MGSVSSCETTAYARAGHRRVDREKETDRPRAAAGAESEVRVANATGVDDVRREPFRLGQVRDQLYVVGCFSGVVEPSAKADPGIVLVPFPGGRLG